MVRPKDWRIWLAALLAAFVFGRVLPPFPRLVCVSRPWFSGEPFDWRGAYLVPAEDVDLPQETPAVGRWLISELGRKGGWSIWGKVEPQVWGRGADFVPLEVRGVPAWASVSVYAQKVGKYRGYRVYVPASGMSLAEWFWAAWHPCP